MSKAVLISIKPEWCGMIALGEKTIEVRKTRPKLETPFKCYIYMTKDNTDSCPKNIFWHTDITGYQHICNGKVIGKFVCDEIIKYPYNCDGYGLKDEANIIARSCVPEKELYHYLQGATPYGWHISNLIMYDKPKMLHNFFKPCGDCDKKGTKRCTEELTYCRAKTITRPPQSWCYVEEIS